jgi:hypothetical protein
MSVPVMLVFDLERVLTSAGAFFLPSNFAHAGAHPLDGDNAFAQLPFAKIYHDSSLPTSPSARAEILDARMAEVVFDRPLPLDLLSAVVCRTSHELEMLKTFIPAGTAQRHMVVEQNGSIFMRREIYVDEIYTKDGNIYLSLTNWSGGDPKVTYRLSSVERTIQGELAAKKVYFTGFEIANPDTVWTLEIEGCLAFRGRIPSASGIV